MRNKEGVTTPPGRYQAKLAVGGTTATEPFTVLIDPRILILDDSTSSVDLTTEALIQKALERLMVGRTTFVIAHRLSTLLRADQILVLDHSRIMARGTHQELLQTSDLYADIYRRQFAQDTVPTTPDLNGQSL